MRKSLELFCHLNEYRSEAVVMMKRQMDAIGRVYSALVELTGVEIPEIEGMIEKYPHEQ